MSQDNAPLSNNMSSHLSGIRDNFHRGNIGDFLKDKIKDNSTLSIVSAYFTIYAYPSLTITEQGMETSVMTTVADCSNLSDGEFPPM